MSEAPTPASPSFPFPMYFPHLMQPPSSFYAAAAQSTYTLQPMVQTVPVSPVPWIHDARNQALQTPMCITPTRVWFSVPAVYHAVTPIGYAPLAPFSAVPTTPMDNTGRVPPINVSREPYDSSPVPPSPTSVIKLGPPPAGRKRTLPPSKKAEAEPLLLTPPRERPSSLEIDAESDPDENVDPVLRPIGALSSWPSTPMAAPSPTIPYFQSLQVQRNRRVPPVPEPVPPVRVEKKRKSTKEQERVVLALSSLPKAFQDDFSRQVKKYEAFLRSNNVKGIKRGSGNNLRYECSKCGEIFQQQKHVSRHAARHFNFPPFECLYCKLDFTRGDSLLRHVARGNCAMLRNDDDEPPAYSSS